MKPAIAALCLVLSFVPRQSTPLDSVAGLLAADRSFGVAGAKTTVVPALTAMFAPDVIMQAPGGMKHGVAAATEALMASANNATATLTWAPVRAGISADGQHGFTYGYMTMTQEDRATVPLKYLAYWVRHDGRWLVAAYKRRPRPAGEVATTLLSSIIPAQLVPMTTDAGVVAGHRVGVMAAEKAFSDDAQMIGIGPAFVKHGWPDAMNMGGPDDAGFLIGSDLIGRNIGQGAPTDSSPVFWSADEVIVASSGDLGVTFGLIRSHPQAGNTAPLPLPQPFFTIWRKVNGVWKYIAE